MNCLLDSFTLHSDEPELRFFPFLTSERRVMSFKAKDFILYKRIFVGYIADFRFLVRGIHSTFCTFGDKKTREANICVVDTDPTLNHKQ